MDIKKEIEKAVAEGRNEIYVPKDNYVITETIVLPKGMMIRTK